LADFTFLTYLGSSALAAAYAAAGQLDHAVKTTQKTLVLTSLTKNDLLAAQIPQTVRTLQADKTLTKAC
jgi:fructose-1,6-bisphosphatase/inositol monophosphatase family enzyme